MQKGDDVVVLWRPEHTRVAATRDASDPNCWDGVVIGSTFLGSYTEDRIRIGGQIVLRWSVGKSVEQGPSQLQVNVEPRNVRVLPAG